MTFQLPRCKFSIGVQMNGRKELLPVQCETVLFEPDSNRMSIVWRGACPCDKKALKVEEVSFTVDQMEGVK